MGFTGKFADKAEERVKKRNLEEMLGVEDKALLIEGADTLQKAVAVHTSNRSNGQAVNNAG